MVASLIIGIDDVHPESSIIGSDCGGDLEKGVLGLLLKFVENNPEVKVTLFVTPNWQFLPQIRGLARIQLLLEKIGAKHVAVWMGKLLVKKWPDDYYRLDKDLYKVWCDFINDLVKTGNFEIGIHGLTHFNLLIRHSAEFYNLSKENCIKKLESAEMIMSNAGLIFVKGFSPPGWGINQNLLNALLVRDYLYCASSIDIQTPVFPGALCRGSGLQEILLYQPTILRRGQKRIALIPRNFDIARSDFSRALKIASLDGVISIHAHIENEYHGILLGNGINLKNLHRLEKLIKILKEEKRMNINFVTFGELALSYLSQ